MQTHTADEGNSSGLRRAARREQRDAGEINQVYCPNILNHFQSECYSLSSSLQTSLRLIHILKVFRIESKFLNILSI